MGFAEFKELSQVLNGWKNVFASFDRDRSGMMEGHELQQATVTMGFHLSPQAMGCIMRRYSTHGRVPFDEFVSCSIRLRSLTVPKERHQQDRQRRVSVRRRKFSEFRGNPTDACAGQPSLLFWCL
ncbi:hypothetical protein F2P81_016606 [Scophthalmus maximus]|uniref:EF-hand domain-containing protein n=1 Tax=Scophthalmus maximus TaxID=52904 RepID=A0A6A4SLN4_SCOMX|nr:hypothetical protein F2P81_016606 [Scophthalmus maximus]